MYPGAGNKKRFHQKLMIKYQRLKLIYVLF